jgi:hypothetical protein
VRIIKEYELFELSLVDNPANQFANVISIEKVNGQDVIDGYCQRQRLKMFSGIQKTDSGYTSQMKSESESVQYSGSTYNAEYWFC